MMMIKRVAILGIFALGLLAVFSPVAPAEIYVIYKEKDGQKCGIIEKSRLEGLTSKGNVIQVGLFQISYARAVEQRRIFIKTGTCNGKIGKKVKK